MSSIAPSVLTPLRPIIIFWKNRSVVGRVMTVVSTVLALFTLFWSTFYACKYFDRRRAINDLRRIIEVHENAGYSRVHLEALRTALDILSGLSLIEPRGSFRGRTTPPPVISFLIAPCFKGVVVNKAKLILTGFVSPGIREGRLSRDVLRDPGLVDLANEIKKWASTGLAISTFALEQLNEGNIESQYLKWLQKDETPEFVSHIEEV